MSNRPSIGRIVRCWIPGEDGPRPAVVLDVDGENPNLVDLEVFGNMPRELKYPRGVAHSDPSKHAVPPLVPTWYWPPRTP